MAERLSHYRGAWTRREATHLLWRAGAGASSAEIDRATADGLPATVARLVTAQPESEEFVATDRLLHRSALDAGNIGALKNWWLYRMLHSANPLVEKMTLLWHNHFATSNAKVRDTAKMATQHDVLRREALGRFDTLFREMSRDVAMLMWLDGNANRKRQPNENFAREVMELFSLGVGNYSETDIKEAARAFTGWHLRNEKFWFNQVQHDPGTKKVLGTSGRLKGEDVLEICLSQPACPRFIATKLLAAFLTPDPESVLLDAVAKRIREHEFHIAPVLTELLSSEAFFAPDARRSIIKSPVDLVIGANKALGGHPHLGNSVQLMSDLGQNLFEPPTVKGWEGGRLWINSATMLQRANFAAEFTSGKKFGKIDPPATDFRSGAAAVDFYTELLLATGLSAGARDDLATHFRKAKGSGTARTASLVHLIMTLPEFQLI